MWSFCFEKLQKENISSFLAFNLLNLISNSVSYVYIQSHQSKELLFWKTANISLI